MNAVTRRRRAIVYTGYVQSLFDHSIRSKLEKYGVDVVRIVDPNRTNAIDFEDCELVIILLELVNSRDVQKIKDEAKRQKVRLIAVHRRINDWERAFNGLNEEETDMRQSTTRSLGQFIHPVPKYVLPPRQAVKLVDPNVLDGVEPAALEVVKAPESSTAIVEKVVEKVVVDLSEEPEKEVSAEYQEFLSLYEEENTRLLEEVRQLREHNEEWNMRESLLRTTIEALSKQLRGYEEKISLGIETAHDAQAALLTELHETQAKLAAAEEKAKVPVTEQTSVEKALEPLKQLWKMGYLSSEEILKKLFKE